METIDCDDAMCEEVSVVLDFSISGVHLTLVQGADSRTYVKK